MNRHPDHPTPDQSDESMIDLLTHTVPKADRAFQQALEHLLMAQLQAHPNHEKEQYPMNFPVIARPVRPISIAPLTWTITLATVAVALIGIVLMNWQPVSTGAPSTVAQVESPVSVVIATQDIEAGTTITDAMVGVITLSQADMDELRITEPQREYLADIESVIGQTAALDISWFQIIETDLLGEPIDPCGVAGAVCSDIPEGYATIMLPALPDMLRGLKNGDRVDVLAAVDGQLRVITANILLMDRTASRVTLAAPYWQHTILVWLYHTNESYALRLHTGDALPPGDPTLVDFVFTSPERLPDDYVFDLTVNVPSENGYLLTGLPSSIDHIPFTSNGDTLYFWFKDFELIDVINGTEVIIRLPQGDAENLEYLIEMNADLTFLPDEDRSN